MSEPSTIRRAAVEIRKEWGENWQGEDPATRFHLAVADWLDACALVEEVAPDRHKANALKVAQAYLGEDV